MEYFCCMNISIIDFDFEDKHFTVSFKFRICEMWKLKIFWLNGSERYFLINTLSISRLKNLSIFNIRTFLLCICICIHSIHFPPKSHAIRYFDHWHSHTVVVNLSFSSYCHKLAWYSLCHVKYVDVICRNVKNHNRI